MIRQLNTLRVRFALWVAGLLLAAFVVFGVFVYMRLASELASAIDDSLRLSAAQALAIVHSKEGHLVVSGSLPESSAIARVRERRLTIRILDSKGTVVQAIGPYRSLPITTVELATARGGLSGFATLHEPSERDPIRFYTTPIIDHNQVVGIVQVAQTLDGVNDTLERLVRALLVGVPAMVCLMAIGGYLLAARALTPIAQITRTAQHISASDLHARLHFASTNDEVGQLAMTFDTMLDRLEASFQRERRFTSDASHELRTPLAAMQTILSVIRERRRTPEEYEQALDDLMSESHRLRGLVEDLLHLARKDAHPRITRTHVNLSHLLHDIADSLSPLAEAKGLVLRCTSADNLVIQGDGDDLIRLIVNVVDNAIKYTVHGFIEVHAHHAEGVIVIRIQDTGIGIAPEHLPRVFDRFYRVDAARSTYGSGLGLSIAREIALAHCGVIDVQSVVDIGTIVTITLPQEQDRVSESRASGTE